MRLRWIMMKQPTERLHAVIHGLVQGVNFRYHTALTAQALALTGWVANRPDGTVEVIAEGPHPALDRLLAFLHHGPSHADVERVDAEWLASTDEFSRFQVLR